MKFYNIKQNLMYKFSSNNTGNYFVHFPGKDYNIVFIEIKDGFTFLKIHKFLSLYYNQTDISNISSNISVFIYTGLYGMLE